MKKIKKLFLCLFILFVLSSCAINSNNSETPSNETTTAEFVFNAPETGPYNESTANTETITLKGVVYRNKFQGNLFLRDPQYDENSPIVESNLGCFYSIKGTDYDLVYNASSEVIGAPESLYCRNEQWQELNAYYSNSGNFSYKLIVDQKGNERKIYEIKEIDIAKLNELVDFCNKNSYDPSSFDNSVITRTISSTVLDEPKYLFGMNSKDGLFSSGAGRFFVVENKLVLEYYTVMSEEKTLVVDVPNDLSDYFISVIQQNAD